MPLQAIELILAFTTGIDLIIGVALHVKTAQLLAELKKLDQ